MTGWSFRRWEVFSSLEFSLINPATLDCREPLVPIRRGRFRRDRLRCQRGVQQVTNRPNPVSNGKRHRWRAAQAFMHAAQIVVRLRSSDSIVFVIFIDGGNIVRLEEAPIPVPLR